MEKLAVEERAATSAANSSATLEDFLKDELDEAEAILAEVVSQDARNSNRASGAAVAQQTEAVLGKQGREEDEEEEERERDDDGDDGQGDAPLGGGRATAATVVATPLEERRHFNKTKWAFNGDASKKQLSTQKGEEVEILRCYMQLGWSFARRVRDSEKGFVPNNYLETVPDESLAQLKWQVGDCCLAQAVSGDWRRGRVMDVGEKTCRVRFEDGSEKVVGSLGITPDTREDEMPAPLMLPKPVSLKRGEFAKHKQSLMQQQQPQQAAQHRNSAPTLAAPAAALPPKLPQQKSGELSRGSSGNKAASADAIWEALQSKVKTPPKAAEPVAAATETSVATASTKDPNKLWEMLQNKVLAPKTAASLPVQQTPPPPSRFQVGDAVWVCNVEDKWVRGEIVGTAGSNWEVVVEATGDMLLRPDNLVRPAKAAGQQVVVVQQVVRSSDTTSSSSNRNSEEDFDEQLYAPVPVSVLTSGNTPTLTRRNSIQTSASALLTPAGTPVRTSTGGEVKSTSGVASWSAANAPRRASQGAVNPNDFALVGAGPGSGAANNGRVVSDAPVPIFTLEGGKRTMMLTPKLTALDIVTEILQRWKMESHANDCVLVSVVRDEMTVVRDTLPLTVKSKWPLIVSSNKNELPKCRFVVRCKEGASPKLREFLGDPLPNAHNLKMI